MDLLEEGDQSELPGANCKYSHGLVHPALFGGSDDLRRRELCSMRTHAIVDADCEKDHTCECEDLWNSHVKKLSIGGIKAGRKRMGDILHMSARPDTDPSVCVE